MNVLGFVFCVLAALSFGAIVAFEKQVDGYRLRAGYLGHIAANRDIFNQTASRFYDSLKSAPSSEEKEEKKQKKEAKNHELPGPPSVNPHCSRLNLSPLIQEDFQKEPYLYEAAAKLLKTFYGETLFEKKSRAEYKFLDAFLKAVRKEFSSLEKVSFEDLHFQMLYYRMLKGTKNNDVISEIGYPSLLDYIKIEPAQSKICLSHSHPNLLSIFFTPRGAAKIYAALHTSKAPPVTQEMIDQICKEVHAPLLDPEVFNLFDIQPNPHAPNSKNTLIGLDPETRISLRKVIPI